MDLVEVERCIIGGRERGFVDAAAEVGGVAGFNGEDAACGGEVVLRCDVGGGAKVR